MPIDSSAIPIRFPRLGRIGVGFMVQANGKTYPTKTKTLVFSSENADRLTEVAAVLGGEVHESPQKEDRYYVVTPAAELEVMLPTRDALSYDAWFELWGKGGLLRKCTGGPQEDACVVAIDPETGERLTDIPCVCRVRGQEGTDRECDPTTRLNVMVPALAQIQGIGVWQVQSRGRHSYQEIAGTIELLRMADAVSGHRLILRVRERMARLEGNKVVPIPVLTLDSTVSLAELQGEKVEPPKLTPPVPEGPLGSIREAEPLPTPTGPLGPVHGAEPASAQAQTPLSLVGTLAQRPEDDPDRRLRPDEINELLKLANDAGVGYVKLLDAVETATNERNLTALTVQVAMGVKVWLADMKKTAPAKARR